jgi:DNA-binding Lrp family transcriptional regulator
MNTSSDDCPLLITVLDLFEGHRPRTLRSVVETLNVSEDDAMAALERLEQLGVLVRTRGGTDTPVWKQKEGATHFGVGVANTPW